MKKLWIMCFALCSITQVTFAAETPQQKTEQPTAQEELKSPFSMMSQSEQIQTGIKKLSPAEQEALITWWAKQKNHPQLHISKEVSLTAIQDNGKYIVLSDGTRLSFAKSYRKKVAKWAPGDKIGIGETGRRGTLTIYHMATGHKVKAKRDQAPEKK